MTEKSQKNQEFSHTLFVGQHYSYLPVVSSTNTVLKEMQAADQAAEGAVVSAGYQTQGRGQAGTVWQSSEALNITLSVLLYPRFLKAGNQFLLSKAIALAGRDFITMLLPDETVTIKWPNDILVSGKKICGILIEIGLKGEQVDYAVCGMGININEVQTDLARTSLKTITGLDYDLKYLERKLFSSIEARYLQARGDAATVSKNYLEVLHGFGQLLPYLNLITNEKFEGTIEGINTDGRLIMRVGDETKMFSLKEVKRDEI